MAEFLLIHGSCHGAWCWRDLIPALARLGHHARAIDLPGSGDDTTAQDSVTLDRCRDAVLAACTPDTIVVGHSWGGYPISAAAEAAPDAMRALVFLCAYVPVSGLSMVEMRRRAPRQTLTGVAQAEPDGVTYSIGSDHVQGLFYHDCPAEAVAYARARLRPQAIAPQDTPLDVGDRFASVPKSYIRCGDDRTIPPEYQSEMVAAWPPETVYEMPTSHSPFFADPSGLATRLDQIAGRV